jgi:hypothetical protein
MSPDASHPDDRPSDAELAEAAGRGPRIIRASWIGTAIFSVCAIATAIAPTTFIAVGVGVSLVLFFVGMAVFAWAYAVAVARSRTDLIGLGGLFFLAGSAPTSVQRSLLGSLGVEIAVALITAAVHPFTPLAFGVLAPMYGLALCGLWGAKHGTFPPRPPDEGRPSGKKAGAGRKGASASSGGASRGGPRLTGGRVTPPGSPGRAGSGGRSKGRSGRT